MYVQRTCWHCSFRKELGQGVNGRRVSTDIPSMTICDTFWYGSGSVHLTNGLGSGRLKNKQIQIQFQI
jgi:hypothetical protein